MVFLVSVSAVMEDNRRDEIGGTWGMNATFCFEGLISSDRMGNICGE
jgi:hypothetical protein